MTEQRLELPVYTFPDRWTVVTLLAVLSGPLPAGLAHAAPRVAPGTVSPPDTTAADAPRVITAGWCSQSLTVATEWTCRRDDDDGALSLEGVSVDDQSYGDGKAVTVDALYALTSALAAETGNTRADSLQRLSRIISYDDPETVYAPMADAAVSLGTSPSSWRSLPDESASDWLTWYWLYRTSRAPVAVYFKDLNGVHDVAILGLRVSFADVDTRDAVHDCLDALLSGTSVTCTSPPGTTRMPTWVRYRQGDSLGEWSATNRGLTRPWRVASADASLDPRCDDDCADFEARVELVRAWVENNPTKFVLGPPGPALP